MTSHKRHFGGRARPQPDLETPEDYMAHARDLFENRRFSDGRDTLQQAARKFPNDYNVQLEYGINRLRAFKLGVRNYDAIADDALSRAINIQPENNTVAKIHLAQLYTRQKRDNEAFELYEDILKADSDNVKALCGIGALYGKRKEFDQAENFLLDALDINHDDRITLTRLGHVYQGMDKHQLARGCFGRAFMLSVEDRSVDTLAERRLREIEDISGQTFTNIDWQAVLSRAEETRKPATENALSDDADPNGAMG